ncbi:CPBP family intramembrane glutamic endopeptidase [Lysinibacillus xylanilyticus]|uniref:CPBP family intramembrane glutamic endopeptidase n=1 Tax=Lysinibacillus xylanilyticus TaxID=582475 RepID=UPI00083C9CE4
METGLRVYRIFTYIFVTILVLVSTVILTFIITLLFNSKHQLMLLMSLSFPLLVCLVIIPCLIRRKYINIFLIDNRQLLITTALYLGILPVLFIYVSMQEPLVYCVHLLVISIAEEFYCRGVLTKELQKSFSRNRTLIIVSLIFALIFHLNESFVQNLFIRFPLGLVSGISYNKTNNIWIPILIHTVYNSLIIIIIGGQ